jgi:hypothetical protein
MAQRDKISILGPKDDGSYVVEFRTGAEDNPNVNAHQSRPAAALPLKARHPCMLEGRALVTNRPTRRLVAGSVRNRLAFPVFASHVVTGGHVPTESPRPNHVQRAPRLGSRRLLNLRIGIRPLGGHGEGVRI